MESTGRRLITISAFFFYWFFFIRDRVMSLHGGAHIPWFLIIFDGAALASTAQPHFPFLFSYFYWRLSRYIPVIIFSCLFFLLFSHIFIGTRRMTGKKRPAEIIMSAQISCLFLWCAHILTGRPLSTILSYIYIAILLADIEKRRQKNEKSRPLINCNIKKEKKEFVP